MLMCLKTIKSIWKMDCNDDSIKIIWTEISKNLESIEYNRSTKITSIFPILMHHDIDVWQRGELT